MKRRVRYEEEERLKWTRIRRRKEEHTEDEGESGGCRGTAKMSGSEEGAGLRGIREGVREGESERSGCGLWNDGRARY